MKSLITLIRFIVGWHFLYEGVAKLMADGWSSESYLTGTYGFMSSFYHWLAQSPTGIQIIDFLNIWGLILIGLALFLGVMVRWAALAATFLLVLYYFAYPPLGITLLGGDGSLFIVDKIMIEAAILVFIVFSKEKGYCLDYLMGFFPKVKKLFQRQPKKAQEPVVGDLSRREALKNLVSLPVLGAFGYGAYHSNQKYDVDISTGATIQINQVALNELKGELPKGKIKNFEISRLIMGGNLIGGWAHARDLIYAGSLFKAYNSEKKIFETLMLCEQAGITAMNIGFPTMNVLQKYKKITGSKLKVTVQVGIDRDNKTDIYDNVTQAIDCGMDLIQLQGNWCDWLVRDGEIEKIAGIVERIRSEGYPAGIGAHTVDSLIACEENGIFPDFYMKTMHHDNYWSAHPRENRRAFEVDGKQYADHNMFHDNCFCPFPDRTVEFVNQTKVPVIGFKVLAAGAIHPKDGFRWAFENGADFVCVGMFDFQVVDDVNICIETLSKISKRTRAWFA